MIVARLALERSSPCCGSCVASISATKIILLLFYSQTHCKSTGVGKPEAGWHLLNHTIYLVLWCFFHRGCFLVGVVYNTKILVLCTHSHIYLCISAPELFVLALPIFLFLKTCQVKMNWCWAHLTYDLWAWKSSRWWKILVIGSLYVPWSDNQFLPGPSSMPGALFNWSTVLCCKWHGLALEI